MKQMLLNIEDFLLPNDLEQLFYSFILDIFNIYLPIFAINQKNDDLTKSRFLIKNY